MTMTAPPRDGLLLPDFTLPRAGGGAPLRPRAYRGKRSLALIFTHGPECPHCRTYLTGALDQYAAYAEESAEVIAVMAGDEITAGEARRELGLPFPVLADADGAAFARYGLTAGRDAAVLVADRYGEPRLWSVAGPGHDLPAHTALLAELRYLALTCAGGACSTPIWLDA
jgi:peroxiredoxin